jgi:ABC-2 type transport system permease protein
LLLGNMVLPWLPAVVLLVAIQTLFVLGVALLVSVLNVYFRDTQHLLSIALQFWFYATPIVYPITTVQEHLSSTWYHIYQLNPMVEFVEAYRDLLYDLRAPSAASIAYLLFVSFATLALGYTVFRRLEPKLAEEL